MTRQRRAIPIVVNIKGMQLKYLNFKESYPSLFCRKQLEKFEGIIAILRPYTLYIIIHVTVFDLWSTHGETLIKA